MTIKEETTSTIIRFARTEKPIEGILMGNPAEPIRPDWVAIIHNATKTSRRTDVLESFDMVFYMDNGKMVDIDHPRETLEIILGVAKLVGAPKQNEWHKCNVEVKNVESVPWKSVEPFYKNASCPPVRE